MAEEVEHQSASLDIILKRRSAGAVLGGDYPTDVEDRIGVRAHLRQRCLKLLRRGEVGGHDPQLRLVLIVDADPQFALTCQLGLEVRSLGVNLVDVLAGRAAAADAIVTGVAGGSGSAPFTLYGLGSRRLASSPERR